MDGHIARAVVAVGVSSALALMLMPGRTTGSPTVASADQDDPSLVHQRADRRRSGHYGYPAIKRTPWVTWEKSFAGGVLLGTPLVADDLLYTGASDGQLHALDPASGDIRWSRGGFEVIESATAIAGDLLIAAGMSGEVFALDRHSGAERWSRPMTAFVFAPPLVADGAVYVATYDRLSKLDLTTGAVIWDADAGSEMSFVSAPALVGDTIVLAVGNDLVAYDAAGGGETWRTERSAAFWGLAISDTLAYLGSADGNFYAFDLATGDERWHFRSRFTAGQDIWSPPAVAGGLVYAGSRDRFLYALDARTGEKRWSFDTGGDAVSDPVVSDGLLYVSDSNYELPTGPRRLYALGAVSGEVPSKGKTTAS